MLVVDDDPNTLSVLQKLLGAEGFDVEISRGPSEALALIERTPFDILLTDLVMGGMTGLRLIEAARVAQPQLRCCVMSGHERTSDASQDILWFAKPLDLDQLLDDLEVQ